MFTKEKEQYRQNNLKKSYTEKKAAHESSGCAIWRSWTKCSFDEAENKPDYYRGRDCIEKLCKKLKEHALKIINYEEKEMILTGEGNRSCHKKYVIYVRRSFVRMKMMKIIEIKK